MVRRDGVRTASSSRRVFRGWFVVVAAFAITFLGFGAACSFSAFLESLERDFSASRGSVSLVFSLAGFLYFGLGSCCCVDLRLDPGGDQEPDATERRSRSRVERWSS